MKSFLIQTFVALLLFVLTACAVKVPQTLERGKYGYHAVPHPSLKKENFDVKKDLDFPHIEMDEETFRRGLREVRGDNHVDTRGIVLEKPKIVPFGRDQYIDQNQQERARSFVFRTTDKHEARWILYPYNFSYFEPLSSDSSEGSSQWHQKNETFSEGALLSTISSEEFPLHTYFNWIDSKTDIELKKAKVIYDINIAVLRIEAERTDENGKKAMTDITYDSDRFCTAFYSMMYPKYDECFVGMSGYNDFIKENPTKSDNPAIVFISPEDIANGALKTKNGENFFGILIIPDIMSKEASYIKNLVGKSSIKDSVRDFVSRGGVLFTTGKGAYLSEYWGFVPEKTFSTRYSFVNPNATYQYTYGCDNIFKNDPPDDSEKEFKESTLCFSLYRPRYYASYERSTNPMISSPMMDFDSGVSHGLTTLLWWTRPSNNVRMLKHDEQTGIDYELPLNEITTDRKHPALMYKDWGKGTVVMNLGNPAFTSSGFQMTYDPYYLAAQRPMAVDNVLVGGINRTVPALEQVNLNVTINVVNYFTTAMKDASLYVYTINGTEVTAPSGCSVVTSGAPSNPSGIVVDKVFLCSVDPTKLSNHSFVFNIRIVSAYVTQQKKDIVILWPHLKYTDPNRNDLPVTVSYGVKIQSAMSALLRADMNIDPCSAYPLPASGSLIDSVLNCENKEETYAYNVKQTSIIPIITPIIDILDQVRLATILIFDKHYYDQNVNKIGKWYFPFPEDADRQYDYLNWDVLINRSNVLVPEWDQACRLLKVERVDLNLPPTDGSRVPVDYVMNANYQTNNDDDTMVLKQIQFEDSERFYEHAVPRLVAFLDVFTEGGANTYWNGTIPEEERSASNPKVGKHRILFARNDLYFYKRYFLPDGLDSSFFDKFITLDRYEKNGIGNKRSVKGDYGNNVEPDGVIPTEYPNAMPYLYERTAFNMTTDDIEAVSGGRVKRIHYLVPIHKLDGTKPGDFYRFDPVTGLYPGYPEVKIVQTFNLDIDIDPEVSRRGGEMVFTFNDGDLPWDDAAQAVSNDYVTVSADQVSIVNIYAKSNKELHIRFMRGQMPNEAYGRPSHLRIFFEGTNWVDNGDQSSDRHAKMDLYELRYDLSKPESRFEDWSYRSMSNVDVTFVVYAAFSLPAFRVSFVIDGALNNSFMNPYERREPLLRYGIYQQELFAHRTVYSSNEFVPINEGGLVTRGGGFSTFTHVGTSSVPFRDLVNTESSLQIPAATETGRIEWDDIWGRHFVQNVRSTVFEYPPIPPPLRNFVMGSTFEILDKEGNRMLGGWHSKQSVDVHVQMKLVNNYPKYFEITSCKENCVMQDCTKGADYTCGKQRIYDTDTNIIEPSGTDDGGLYFKSGHNATYGICYADGIARLEGQNLTRAQQDAILALTLCAKTYQFDQESCQFMLEGLPILKKVPVNNSITGSLWNYAERVYNHYPKGYITEEMWDMSHYDYVDDKFNKAYKDHYDNNLPHLERLLNRTDNLVAFPLFKGLGYSMVYDKNYWNPAFGEDHKGWWSDNLQNHDNTLLAGQEFSNEISVGKPSLINDSEWIDISKMHIGSGLLAATEKNIYRCLFNRRSVKQYKSNERFAYLQNVYENNVVPVPPNLNKAMEQNYQCDRNVWYSPLNISQFPNVVYTETPRDWLYFSANLRGGARENINVLYQMNPLNTTAIKYEGHCKVDDGARFQYWNPGNSKNSWLVHDNNVNVILARRNDIITAQEAIPTYTTTFDSVVYDHFTLTDPEEIEREWTLPVWTNSYGYGDFSTQVYVGDAKTTALPEPGTTIRARVTFNNNAGFDINMLKGAINSTEVSQEAINAYDMMHRVVRALKRPDSYNFMELQIPDEIKPYVKIYPCPTVVGIAPLFFDFEAINVVTIRDGWKADYYYNIEISKNFPDELRGRLIEIPIVLVKQYFDALPGKKDKTGIHDYEIEIPPLVFGVPYAKNHPLWAGKVFYVSGYSTNIDLRTILVSPYKADKALVVTREELEKYRSCLGLEIDPNQTVTDGEFACLDRLFAQHMKDRSLCEYEVRSDEGGYQSISFEPCLAKFAPQFPIKVPPVEGADRAEINILMRAYAPQAKRGNNRITSTTTTYFKDWRNKYDSAPTIHALIARAKGAWITLKWSASLLSTSGMALADPVVSPNSDGLADITITLENTGDYYAYNVFFNLTLPVEVRVATEKDFETGAGLPIPPGCGVGKVKGDQTMFWCDVANVLPPSLPRSYVFRVYFGNDTRKGAGYGAKSPLDMRVIADKSTASIDLTSAAGEKRVTQDLEGPYGIKYTKLADQYAVVLDGKRGEDYDLKLTASHKLENIRHYIWRAKLPKGTVWNTFAVTDVPTIKEDVSKRYSALKGDKGDDVAVDYVVAVSRDKGNVTVENSDTVLILGQSNIYKWRVEDNNLILLLLLIPAVVIPAAIIATVLLVKGRHKDTSELKKEKFVPEDVHEPIPMEELPSEPATPAAAPEAPVESATAGKSNLVPTGPTYIRSGVPVNVVGD